MQDMGTEGCFLHELAALKQLPSRADFDRACEVAWKEASALAKQLCGMKIPSVPLKSADLHPHFCPASDSQSQDGDSESSDCESDSEALADYPLTANDVDLELAADIRVQPHPCRRRWNMRHIVTERYLEDLVAQDEAELEAIDRELDANPETPMPGRMQIAYTKWTKEMSHRFTVISGRDGRRQHF
ncbi:hypothetical protein B0H14DRAFT_3713295 [Mycena olivaceomarginata]|nr:hypothetical protein B0H14DRAFT_3713295 [Mycena olivaceomarginata]